MTLHNPVPSDPSSVKQDDGIVIIPVSSFIFKHHGAVDDHANRLEFMSRRILRELYPGTHTARMYRDLVWQFYENVSIVIRPDSIRLEDLIETGTLSERPLHFRYDPGFDEGEEVHLASTYTDNPEGSCIWLNPSRVKHRALFMPGFWTYNSRGEFLSHLASWQTAGQVRVFENLQGNYEPLDTLVLGPITVDDIAGIALREPFYDDYANSLMSLGIPVTLYE